MKSFLIWSILLFGTTTSAAELCKVGDIKDCGKVLKAKEGAEDFNLSYNQICKDNKTFKCLKRTVRGDIKEEMKYVKEEFPKAYIFETKESGDDKIFVIDKR